MVIIKEWLYGLKKMIPRSGYSFSMEVMDKGRGYGCRKTDSAVGMGLRLQQGDC